MHNLLLAPLPETKIATILAQTAGRPALPPLSDSIWSDLRNNPAVTVWLNPVIELATAESEQPLPELTDELYADFFKTGNRLPFEQPYFERRRRLGRAAMAVLLGDVATRTRLLPSFLAKLNAVFDETSWSLPAHVWSAPTGKDPMTIDLFAAECVNNFADLLVVFEEVIPAELAARIRERLRIQAFENYANREPAFQWTTLPMNWNAVCHQGVLGAALAIEQDHALVARMLTRAAACLPIYLEGFGNDGSTSEGPGYWSYGFGWFSELNAQLEHRTDGQFSLFEGDAKVGRIARFAPLMTLSNSQMVNFSDGGRTGLLAPALLTYLGQRLDDPILIAQGASLYRQQAETGVELGDLRRDFFNMSRLALRTPSPEVLANAREPEQPDAYFEDYGAIVARGTDARGHLWEFAAKGGHNAEHHNHNDCGSFLLNIDGAPALIEIGAPEYVRAFFSDQRYEFLAARSLGHSVPFVNGHEQRAGREFAATVLKAEVGTDRVEFIVDLTRCYPPEARCKKLHRTFVLEKNAGTLSVSDTYELEDHVQIESLLITNRPVTHNDNHAQLQTERGANLRITPGHGTRLTHIETCDYRGHKGTDEHVQRLRFAPGSAAPTLDGMIIYTIRLS